MEYFYPGTNTNTILVRALKINNLLVDSCSVDMLCHPPVDVCLRKQVGNF